MSLTSTSLCRCFVKTNTRPLSEEDLNKAIDFFCPDGAEIKGFGKYWEGMTDYPPQRQTQFYPHEGMKYHLTIGAQQSIMAIQVLISI